MWVFLLGSLVCFSCWGGSVATEQQVMRSPLPRGAAFFVVLIRLTVWPTGPASDHALRPAVLVVVRMTALRFPSPRSRSERLKLHAESNNWNNDVLLIQKTRVQTFSFFDQDQKLKPGGTGACKSPDPVLISSLSFEVASLSPGLDHVLVFLWPSAAGIHDKNK